MERYLILLLLVILLIAFALSIAFCVTAQKLSEEGSQEICTTPGCIYAASTVLKYMDESVDPCDNFYRFACGKYIKNTNIPEDETSIAPTISIDNTIEKQLKMIIEELPTESNKPYRLMKTLYNMCMNTTAIESDSIPYFLKLLKDMGGWPLLEDNKWNENNFDWKQLLYKLRKHAANTDYFISLRIGTESINSSRRIIRLDQAGLGLSREFLIKGFEEKLVKAYYEYMVDIAVLFGADKNASLKELKETLELEIRIANVILPKQEYRTAPHIYMKVEDLFTAYPFIPWVEYINNILIIPNITITTDEGILVGVLDFLPKIEKVLSNTPKRVLANYIFRRVALDAVSYMPDEFINKKLKYYRVLTGQREREARWKTCTRIATKSLSLASGASYVKKYFNKSIKKHAKEIVADIRAEFVKMLQKADWMDKVTKRNALEKAASMTAYIGYPDELLNEKNLEKYYADLEITSNKYIEAMKHLSLFFADYRNKKLREPVNKTEWTSHAFPPPVRAFYSFTGNSIEFSAGILQGIFFDNDRPRYMNYGGIGCVIGHEITHGFDDRGRKFDKNGDYSDWWEKNTKTAFMKKAQCIIDQYGNYNVPEVNLNINGIITQGENIADNGGIKVAYLGYQAWVARNNPEPRLPGLKYTPNQMFWISAAHISCDKPRREEMKLRVTTGQHPPGEYRVVVPFGNSGYFAKDFNCPLGSKMNPVNKCSVW
ncbi:hypothetical protein ILUMI_02562 [Ignelater luminosus]|uniref:Uncharacterized protein n=1 Tax=Ignelater luminosus TaxID=2038154 RepID=A0A8K0GGC6_IGNLU|nr:hypothetical protein ILUMI_02562 [Ignelater luminosus]